MKCKTLILLAIPALAGFPPQAKAITLGTAGGFAVLGGSTVTNTGSSVVSGNLGVSPGTAITGFPPGTVVPPGTIHAADAVAGQAQSDLTIAYDALAGMACNTDLTGQDLGGQTLTPSVYCFSSSAQLTGTLTLNGNGPFVFQIGSTLTTASNSSVLITNGGPACNVFWQVGSSATLGTGTAFVGNILALTSITLTTGANVSGRALARNGAVTMDTNNISTNSCVSCDSDTDCAPGLVCDVNVKVCVCTSNTPIVPICGDGHVDCNEECDGADDAACPGHCRSDCTCPSGVIGCRITGGWTVPDGAIVANPNGTATLRGQGGGQVGAPCGCTGCFTTPDPNDDLAFQHIQGNWQYSRKNKQGTFHAKEYNSLICGCDANSPVCDGTGVAGSGLKNPANFTGDLCNPGDPIPGPEPRKAPANVACFSGIGSWTLTNGKKETLVAFRVEVEDRGEPAVGPNADDTCDVVRIRIWIPTASDNVKLLADGACCTNSVPVSLAARLPDIDDGGNLVHGNIQIYPELPNTRDGTCPVPNGSCQQP